MSEQTIDEELVREEHLAEVNQAAHWAYLAGVMFTGTLLMLAFIAWLGASGG
jgi:hypothetical protein